MTLNAFYREALTALSQAGCDVPDLALRRILKMRAGIEWSDLITQPDMALRDDVIDALNADVARHIAGEPLSKLYGVAEFFGLEFAVNEHVLDPRPDTETLIERALEIYRDEPPARIIDLGTGSGCIVVTLLEHFKTTQAVAVDASQDALNIARQNAEKHDVADRVMFMHSSWLDDVILQDGDLIVSNPPYIRSAVIPNLEKSVRNHDPILALDGGDDGLQPYKMIFSQILSQKKQADLTGLRGLFEIGFDQGDDLARLVEESRFTFNGLILDSARNPRVVDISF